MSKPSLRSGLHGSHALILTLALLFYLYLSFVLPTPTARPAYQFTDLQILVIRVTVLVPWLATIVLGLVGYLRLQQYSKTVADPAAGRPFKLLSHGIMVLVWGM